MLPVPPRITFYLVCNEANDIAGEKVAVFLIAAEQKKTTRSYNIIPHQTIKIRKEFWRNCYPSYAALSRYLSAHLQLQADNPAQDPYNKTDARKSSTDSTQSQTMGEKVNKIAVYIAYQSQPLILVPYNGNLIWWEGSLSVLANLKFWWSKFLAP